ncbi:BC1872 family protein [Bacillus cereus group sp. MYBK228-1]|uniref:BC1872 family protein n=1 Tax=unclassified Bacillus cereus group TaxID=2750818 RepID=UPI003F79E59D
MKKEKYVWNKEYTWDELNNFQKDELVAIFVMELDSIVGAEPNIEWYYNRYLEGGFHYTTFLPDALTLVRVLTKDNDIQFAVKYNGKEFMCCFHSITKTPVYSCCKTLEEAICLAALRHCQIEI